MLTGITNQATCITAAATVAATKVRPANAANIYFIFLSLACP
jgi:hypothetical protein